MFPTGDNLLHSDSNSFHLLQLALLCFGYDVTKGSQVTVSKLLVPASAVLAPANTLFLPASRLLVPVSTC